MFFSCLVLKTSLQVNLVIQKQIIYALKISLCKNFKQLCKLLFREKLKILIQFDLEVTQKVRKLFK